MLSNRQFLRLVVTVSCLAAIVLCSFSLQIISPAFTRLTIKNTEAEAVRVAQLLLGSLYSESAFSGDSPVLSPAFRQEATRIVKDLNVVKIKVFAPSGKTLFSTVESDNGATNTHDYFQTIVAKGGVLTKVVKKETKSLEGQTFSVDVVETYVPVMIEGRFAGAFEIYLDITAKKRELNALLFRLNALMVTIAVGLLAAMLIISWRARINFIAQEKAEQKILEQSAALLSKNGELSMVNDLSQVLSTSIDPTTLLPAILKTVVERLAILRISPKGGIFIINGEKMELVTHLGHSAEFVKMHEGITTADCLCGQAAQTGKVIISTDSHSDSLHTISYPGMEPHGHIIVPLTSGAKVMGILCLYLPEGVTIDVSYRTLLQSIGAQIGMAIDNARLYGETRQLSLHDPLTGLANRRLMDLNLQQAIGLAERYRKPLAIAMFDIDYFKKYNDCHGHTAGDRLLVQVANLLSAGSRNVDLIARYGGEEFLFIMPETEITGAQLAAERIRQSIAEKCGITISIGIALFKAGDSQEQLVKAADRALYRAKANGRNRIEFAE